ncbi:hypothetical protein PH5382_02200 [Phaeobacter sp. CECT 5382]|nr:hypothetical protein PH5382_02200 [Phaeobacter sp. CECT 5382]
MPKAQTSPSQDPSAPQVSWMPLTFCGLDDFEEGLLPLLRHFLTSLKAPERQSWQYAYKIAAERWGEVLGLRVAQALFKLIDRAVKARGEPLEFLDPLAPDERGFVTRDEFSILRMLHHMRRDETPMAREAVALVTGDTMDPEVIRAGLSFAHRFPVGLPQRAAAPSPLRLVE